MTKQRINTALHKIESCIKKECFVEALLHHYHLNIEIIVFLLRRANPEYGPEGKKPKKIIADFLEELSVNPHLKAIISKKAFKPVKTWMDKMEAYFKQLKRKEPGNSKLLLHEAEKIFGLLFISFTKLMANPGK